MCMKLRIKSATWNIKKQKTTNQNCKKKKRTPPKNEDRAKSLWDNLKHSNIHIIGVADEEKEQKIRNLFGKIMYENFPNLVKEIDIQVQEA